MSVVLIIDDDPIFLDAVAESLERGHRDIQIETATTAVHGLRLVGLQHFDAIVSDFRMAGLNGIDFLKECAVACPHTPVIVLTGYGSPELERDALEHGAYAVLQKPIDSEVIYSAITRAILRAEMLGRSPICELTPQVLRLHELLSERQLISAKIQAITDRLQSTLRMDEPS